jgi:hypothetical protein
LTEHLTGDLSVILGAVVGALHDQGYSAAEIHTWIDAAIRVREAGPVDEQVAAAVASVVKASRKYAPQSEAESGEEGVR